MSKISPVVLWSCAIMIVLFLTAVIFRPLLPIDETRYMTVAWEMRLNNAWLAPLTLNFEPYSHKPPMLFWLINLFWSLFGISRWAGLIPVALISLSCVFLTIRLGRRIFSPENFDATKIMWLLLGSVPFFIYSTLVMFDMAMMALTICSLLCLLTYAEKRQFRYMFLLGLFTGLALLTKGPVAWLYVIFPMLLGPWWVQGFSKPLSWYADCTAGLLISIIPLSIWLLPVLSMSDNNFAFWLLWQQSAGRVAGNFSDAHVRPFYFYLPLLPLIFAPWIFLPAFWKSLKPTIVDAIKHLKNPLTHLPKKNDASIYPLRFIICWILPVFLCFSMISGKQPHYLIPLMPGVIFLIAILLKSVPIKTIRHTACVVIILGIFAQSVAAQTFFRSYDLKPIASYVEKHQGKDWAWVRNYHGEIGFIGKIKKPITNLDDRQKLAAWFDEHPEGLAVVRYNDKSEVAHLKEIASSDYRGKHMGIFAKN